MSQAGPKSYLQTEVLTAPPQKLHLMLIEGAIRSIERARQHWQEGDDEAACENLIRGQQIMTELLGGLDDKAAPALARKVAGVYLFVFRRLAEANLARDPARLADAQQVLEVERETWRLLCEKLGSGNEGEAPPETPLAPPVDLPAPPPGLSLEA
jgi:flagellar protein FliS